VADQRGQVNRRSTVRFGTAIRGALSVTYRNAFAAFCSVVTAA
jgi:hypothetical protein